ncbi:phospholipid scramblase 1-like isoform X2 [Dermacentor albipictus]|uniref:phospholipid scramblase 1-like isoform X2 n=1 Tax=Dermacentor albipictus TaxID=60249 RepID=UPI0038FD3180
MPPIRPALAPRGPAAAAGGAQRLRAPAVRAFTGIETCNAYTAKNSMGQFIYHITENSGCCARCCCGPRRCLEMDVRDYKSSVVMHFVRPLRCVHTMVCCVCWCCCLQEMEVQAPPGNTIAHVYQKWSLCYPSFSIHDRNQKRVLDIVGPLCTQSIPCKCDVEFTVYSTNGQPIGKISKHWSGLLKEYFTDADTFGVSFPLDMDVHLKAALIAATMLIDYMFFEEAYGQNDDKGPGVWN